MFNEKKKISLFRCLKWFLVLALLTLVTLPFVPISLLNPLLQILPHSVRLIDATGSISQGSFQKIEIKGKKYPLYCSYTSKKVDLEGVTYHIKCRAPLKLQMIFSTSWFGDITIEKSRLSGELSQASDWLVLAGYPSSVNGYVDIAIDNAQLVGRKLVELDVTGESPAICLFSDASVSDDLGRDCLNDLSITTPQKVLTPTQPIQVVVIAKPKDTSQFHFKSTSDIDGERQQTRMVLSGKATRKYAPVLRMIGREEGLNIFSIALEGQLFQ